MPFRESRIALETIRDNHLKLARKADAEGDTRSSAEHHRAAALVQTALGAWFTEKADHEVAVQRADDTPRTVHG